MRLAACAASAFFRLCSSSTLERVVRVFLTSSGARRREPGVRSLPRLRGAASYEQVPAFGSARLTQLKHSGFAPSQRTLRFRLRVETKSGVLDQEESSDREGETTPTIEQGNSSTMGSTKTLSEGLAVRNVLDDV